MGKVVLVSLAVVGIVGLVIGFSLLLAYPTMWVVNYLFAATTLKAIFGISQLTFWKAFWLNFICGTLFKRSSTTTASK